MIQPIISILICALESRKHFLKEMMDNLNEQMRYIRPIGTVEVLIELDNKENTTGFKRQSLLDRSKGKHIVYADEDDYLYPYYLSEMIRGCKSDCDCIAINGIMTTDGKQEIKWRLSKDYDNVTITENGENIYLRRTNHITAVKREIALVAGFPDYSNGEDKYYSERLNLKTEFILDKPMYHYKFLTYDKQY